MQNRARFSFAVKIALVVIMLTLTIDIVVSIAVGRLLSQTLETEFESKGTTIVRSLSISVEELLTAQQRAQLQGKLEQYLGAAGLKYIAVLDPKGEVMAHTLSPTFPEALGRAFANDHGTLSSAGDDIHVQTVALPEIGRALDISQPVLNGILGTVHVGMDLDLITARVRSAVWRVLGLAAAVSVLGVIVSVIASRTLAQPIAALVKTASSVAAGDLDVTTDKSTQREFPVLASSFDGMVTSLRGIARGVRKSSADVGASASQILESSYAQNAGIATQNASIEEIAYTMQSLSATADAITARAHELSQLGADMSERMRVVQDTMSTARTAIVGAANESDRVAKQTLELYEKSRTILDVVDIIDGISDRLDLLALNAALEGARAGDLGKGFALVAREMRRLAENVLLSTREVKETLSLVQSLARVAASNCETSASATRDGVREVESMVEVTQAMFDLISQSADKSQQIRGITEQQRTSVSLVANAMGEMGTSADEARRLSQGVMTAASQLAAVATALRAEVERFRIKP